MFRLNREKVPMLSSIGAEQINSMHIARDKEMDDYTIHQEDFFQPISVLYEALWQFRRPDYPQFREKVYVMSKSILKKTSNMNINSLMKPNGLKPIMDTVQPDHAEVAHLITPVTDKDLVCGAYVIIEGALYGNVFHNSKAIGYIMYNRNEDGELELIPYSLLSMMGYNSYPKSREVARRMAPLVEQFNQDFGRDGEVPMEYITNRRKSKKGLHCAGQIDDYWNKRDLLEIVLKQLIFLKTSQVYSQEYVTDNTPTYRRKPGYKPLNYIQVDATWDKEIDVNNPFPVRGHFTHQPCKVNGEWTRKLIYVEEYMKKGYHRRAKKTIVESE